MCYGLNEQLLFTFDLLEKGEVVEEHYLAKATDVVTAYLKHVISTMCLCDRLDAQIHDWADIEPVYARLFAESIRTKDLEKQREHEELQKLLVVLFPEFEPKSASKLARALDDKRIESLRSMVRDSIATQTQFDADFANRVLREVLETETKLSRTREVVGWATKPLSFLPWVGFIADTIAGKAVESLVAQRMRRPKSWFYLLSEINCPGGRADS